MRRVDIRVGQCMVEPSSLSGEVEEESEEGFPEVARGVVLTNVKAVDDHIAEWSDGRDGLVVHSSCSEEIPDVIRNPHALSNTSKLERNGDSNFQLQSCCYFDFCHFWSHHFHCQSLRF